MNVEKAVLKAYRARQAQKSGLRDLMGAMAGVIAIINRLPDARVLTAKDIYPVMQAIRQVMTEFPQTDVRDRYQGAMASTLQRALESLRWVTDPAVPPEKRLTYQHSMLESAQHYIGVALSQAKTIIRNGQSQPRP